MHSSRSWDIVILIGLLLMVASAASVAWPAIQGESLPLMRYIAGSLAALCATLIAYGSFIEPRLIRINHLSFSFSEKRKLRIVFVSDIHAGTLKGSHFVQRIVEHINAQDADLVLIGGDFVQDHQSPLSPLEPLQHIKSRSGVFAVTGNHDTGYYVDLIHNPFRALDRSDDLELYLKDIGIPLLRNEMKNIDTDDGPIQLVGIDDLWSQDEDSLSTILETIDRSAPSILLSHQPDILLHPDARRANLILCGHTHGGQIRLPCIGSLIPIPSLTARKYDQGLFTIDHHTTLFVSHGVGESHLRSRLCAMPEIVVFEYE